MDMLFIKVLNMSISASWLVLVVLALRFLLKKAPRWIHVALWALVAVRLICPVSIESVFSLIPSTRTVPEEIFYMEPPLDGQNTALEIVEPRPDGGAVDVELDTPVSVAQTKSVRWAFLWPVGMGIMVIYALISYLRLKRKVSASIDVGNGVYICDYIDTPFILGIVKPMIYLPSSMEPDSASHVLAHERAHIARKDHWWKPFGYLLLSVYWFNPVLWLAYILLCRDIELACDEKVIRDMAVPEKKAYSEALLSCSVNRRIIAACPLAFGEVGVKQRIKSVLNYKKPGFWLILVAVIALIVTAVCFLTDPVQWSEEETAQWFEEYAYEQVAGRMDRENVHCIAVQDDFALVYCQGEGPALTLYQFEQDGSRINLLGSGTGEYALSGGMSLNHAESGGRHIYFGTISEYHFNPIADTNTWLNWDYLTITDENGREHKQDMTGKDGFLFVLDTPMADFQAVDGLGTVVLNQEKFYEQGYSVRICHFVAVAATSSPFGKYYRAIAMDYMDGVSSSYLGILTDNLYLLSEGHALLSLDAMAWNKVTTVARFSEKELPEDFVDLFLLNPELGASLQDNNRNAWEYWDTTHTYENDKDGCYLLQQNDGELYLVTASRWTAQYREGEDKALRVYRLAQVETDDPFAKSDSPYQWTLNLRPKHVLLVQTTVYDADGAPHRTVLGQRERNAFMQIINSLTQDQFTLGDLKNDHVVSCYVQCMDENGWAADLDVNLQYDGSAVRMVFTTEGAKRYPEETGESWIIRSEALNEFLSVYTYKPPEEDPFSDPDNAYRWCRNISPAYLKSVFISREDGVTAYLGEVDALSQLELLRILNSIPESAFTQSQMPERTEADIIVSCRNVLTDDPDGIGVTLGLLDGDVYYTQADAWSGSHQTWKISSHALAELIRELSDSDGTAWLEFPMTGGVGLGADSHSFVTQNVGGLEMSIPELDCFQYQVSDDGIRFKPEHVDGWILVQYRTEPFAVCGTGLETSEVTYKNGKYTGIQGWYDGNEAWGFIDLTTTDGDVAYNVVLLNEESAPWVTEYFYEIVEVICELSFLVAG